MNGDIYLTLTRQQTLGRCHHLDEAIKLARERTTETFLDAAIWHGDELVAVVQAGGNVVHLTGETWQPSIPADEPNILIDLDLLDPSKNL